MEKLQTITHLQLKFEGNKVEIIQDENGNPLFEIYSTGMALGYTTVAKSKAYPQKIRIDKIVKNAEIKPVVHGVQHFITESQLYDFMLEARTEKCRTFRKWLTNEVLPSIRKNGSYSVPSKDKQLELYEYFDKTYDGEPVLSIADVSHMTGINRTTIGYFIRKRLTIGIDYYLLKKSELESFKAENPKVNKLASCMYVITKYGFDVICKAYGIKLETPKLFIEEKQEVPQDKIEPAKFVTPQLKEKMSVLRNNAERLIHLTYLLDNVSGTMMCGSTYVEFKKAIISQIKQLSYINL